MPRLPLHSDLPFTFKLGALGRLEMSFDRQVMISTRFLSAERSPELRREERDVA
jgi:hypothetical protein